MAKDIKNLAALVNQRLHSRARKSFRPFNELLQQFAIERFMYWLCRCLHADRFILNGALLLCLRCEPASRRNKDIDLPKRVDNSIEWIVAVFKDACRMDSVRKLV